MNLDGIDIDSALAEVENLLNSETGVPPAFVSMMKLLVMIVKLLMNRVGLNSKNSSKPPASDPNRLKPTRKKSGKKPGGQNGHIGTTLKQVENPDEIERIEIDRKTLPKGQYDEIGFETRQVFDIYVSEVITEYQAQILQDQNGKQFVAPFPDGVTKAVQYGNTLKAHAVYMSQYQLLPYKRIEEYFSDQLEIPVSQGSIFNFNKEAYEKLSDFEEITKEKLATSAVANADETGINIESKRHWLHCVSNESWTHFYPHEKRGTEAMDAIGIIPKFKGVLCHDHWKPYYRYDDCLHSLCNAHHLRELTRAHEQDKQEWAGNMQTFLEAVNKATHNAGGKLNKRDADQYRQQYRDLLKTAEIECPAPDESQRKRKRGRLKRSKARNLLERLINYENDVLRFMDNLNVPFTNNRGENDIRMTKVQQKISGCFRSMDGAKIFRCVRGYLSTCRKQGVASSDALKLLYEGKLPNFVFD